jgi:RNA polymerase sigma factor (sigma-70 family)
MTSGYPAFRALVERVRQGDHDAAVILVQHYGPDMLRVVRKSLALKARCVLDSADVMQSAWRSFFTHGLFTQDFTDERELRHYLQRLSRSKVLNVNKRYLDSQRRDLRRACSLDDLSPEARQRLLDTGPSAAEATAAKEILERLMAVLPPRYLPMIFLLRDGYSRREIAERLGCTERSVTRVVSRMLESLDSSFPVDSS